MEIYFLKHVNLSKPETIYLLFGEQFVVQVINMFHKIHTKTQTSLLASSRILLVICQKLDASIRQNIKCNDSFLIKKAMKLDLYWWEIERNKFKPLLSNVICMFW